MKYIKLLSRGSFASEGIPIALNIFNKKTHKIEHNSVHIIGNGGGFDLWGNIGCNDFLKKILSLVVHHGTEYNMSVGKKQCNNEICK